MRRKKLIPGPVLLGFADAFEESKGKPHRGPLPQVTPSRIGEVLLPFMCPHCGAVRSEVVDPRRREHYSDKERGFSFCPACRGRYVIHFEGMPLAEALPPGATHAPARVERGGKVEVLASPRESGLDLLGAQPPDDGLQG